jgi:nucleoid DNA-binding protein
MKTKDFIRFYASRNGLRLNESIKQVTALFDTLSDCLAHDKEITIHKFGRFYTYKVKDREMINPNTKEKVKINSHLSAKFSPSPILKMRVNS